MFSIKKVFVLICFLAFLSIPSASASESFNLKAGMNQDLGYGYEFVFSDVDSDYNKAILLLYKDGELIDDTIVRESEDYLYTEDPDITIEINILDIYQGQTNPLIKLKCGIIENVVMKLPSSLSISSSPSGAKVYLDGTYEGTTPLTLDSIEEGSYRLALKKSGYEDIYESVNVNAGDTTTISKSLSEETGSLRISSNPSGAKVYLDGKYKGPTPLTLDNIEAGSYRLALKKSGYEDIFESVNINAADTTTISKSLSEETGSLRISSNPSGAKVYLDGTYEGTTPISIYDLETGLYEIKFEKTGYETVSFKKMIYTGSNSVSRNLTSYISIAIGPAAIFLILLFGIIVVRKKRKSKSEYQIQSSNDKDKSVNIKTDPDDVKIMSSVKNDKTEFDTAEPNSSSSKLENTIPSKPTTKNEIPNINYSENNKIERVDEKNTDFCIKSAFNYKGATIQYKVKVENPTSEPFADIKVNLYIPDVFILSESTKSIPILKPSESKTVTFDIRPTGECGDCEVSGKVVYYDYKTKKTTEAPIPSKNVSIVCPMINSKKIDESQWRDTLTGLTKAEETTREIDIPASTLFDMASDVLQDMNLFMLDPKVNDSDNLYRAVAKFYGEGVKDLKYAAQIEIVGGSKKSKLILKAWAEKEEALTGFYHGILDELEKRTQIKGNINENIIQNYYHYGDKVGTQISDSLVQRSNIGVSNSGDKDEYQIPESIEDHQINSKSYDELSYDGVYNYLVDVAHKACGNKSKILNNIDSPSHRKSLYENDIIVTYGDVLKIFGKIPNNRAHQMELIKILDDINRNNKPILLSSLVVNGDKYRPSEQFFKKWTNNSWESELEKIWDYYCD
ncbi:PEGA domain-containing protein [Methanohalophilus sp.]